MPTLWSLAPTRTKFKRSLPLPPVPPMASGTWILEPSEKSQIFPGISVPFFPASPSAPLPMARKLVAAGKIKKHETVVLFNTGGALKYLDLLR